jgi:hypothetical protein
MKKRAIATLAVLAIALPAQAQLVRPDRDDAEYLELATHYPSAIALDADAQGVLISPHWILTSAQAAKALQDRKPTPRISVAGRNYEIRALFLHPDAGAREPADIALVHLKDRVPNVEATPLHKSTDEEGRTVIVVGQSLSGKLGTATLPKEKRDARKRAGVNTVDAVTARTLRLRIKPPDEASDLQGAAGPGDRGGPLYVKVDDEWFVAGVGRGVEDANRDGITNAGDIDVYVRVSAFVSWIEATMIDVAKQEAEALLRAN